MKIGKLLVSGVVMYAGFKIGEAVHNKIKNSDGKLKRKLYHKTIKAVDKLYGVKEHVIKSFDYNPTETFSEVSFRDRPIPEKPLYSTDDLIDDLQAQIDALNDRLFEYESGHTRSRDL